MNNTPTYYAVQISYKMPEFLNRGNAFGVEPPPVMDSRFYTRATTMPELHLDLRKFAIEIATEAKEVALMSEGDIDGEVSFTLEELEQLVMPTICRLVPINNPATVEALSTAISLEGRLDNVIEAMAIMRPGVGMLALRKQAAGLKSDLGSMVRELITQHLYLGVDTISLVAIDKALDEALTFLNSLRQTQ